VLGLTLDDLMEILDLEDLEENLYRGRIPKDSRDRVFGGQVVGQALVAAQEGMLRWDPDSGQRQR
jgi:acyl-CoA thioesterase